MQYFHFERLIAKYSTEFKAVIPDKGGYVDGEYIKGETERQTLTGAILDIDEKKIRNSNGTLTTKDKQLYMTSELANDLTDVRVVYDGKVYSVEDEKENRQFTGFCAYILTYVSAFDKGGLNSGKFFNNPTRYYKCD